MRTFKTLLLIVFISTYNYAQLLLDTDLQKITEVVDTMPEGFALSLAIIKDKEVEYLGFLKRNDSIIDLDLRDSLYEIGSITKVFTSTILSTSILNNTLKFSDHVNSVFPYPFKDSIALSYLSLANHTSGMSRLPSNIMPFIFKNRDNPYREYTYAMFDDYLKGEIQLENRDSVKYNYSNLGAGLLAYALSKAHQTPFENLLDEHIFKPYNMHSTSYKLHPSIEGLNPYGAKTSNWQFDALKGAGGIVSNTRDLANFILAQFNSVNVALALSRKETFSVNENMSIGLGWHILEANSESKKYWHNGGTGGYTSSLSFRTSNQTGVVILSNISAMSYQSPSIDKLCFELLDALK